MRPHGEIEARINARLDRLEQVVGIGTSAQQPAFLKGTQVFCDGILGVVIDVIDSTTRRVVLSNGNTVLTPIAGHITPAEGVPLPGSNVVREAMASLRAAADRTSTAVHADLADLRNGILFPVGAAIRLHGIPGHVVAAPFPERRIVDLANGNKCSVDVSALQPMYAGIAAGVEAKEAAPDPAEPTDEMLTSLATCFFAEWYQCTYDQATASMQAAPGEIASLCRRLAIRAFEHAPYLVPPAPRSPWRPIETIGENRALRLLLWKFDRSAPAGENGATVIVSEEWAAEHGAERGWTHYLPIDPPEGA